jgi:8-amino-7-oxononanoate synthase
MPEPRFAMLIDHLSRQLRERDMASLRRRRRIVESSCAPRTSVCGDEGIRAMLAYCSNDYLGLAADHRLQTALAQGAQRYGAGSGASHLISGHSRAHAMLEEELAAWMDACVPGAEALTFCSGYMANVALVTALGTSQATLFADKLNHASLIDGGLLARATVHRYPHGRMDRLAAQLERCETSIKLIVTDAVFSMDGDIAPLPQLLELADRHDAWIVLDDAHGFGVLGHAGRGTMSHFGIRSDRVICMGTLGKAAGVAGAFVAAHPVVIDWLVQTARSYIYTTATPPALVAAALASLRIIRSPEGDERRARLMDRVRQLREGVGNMLSENPHLGWRLADSPTAIQPLIVGDNVSALKLSEALERRGLWVPAVRPPTVPAGEARLRIALSAAHTGDDVQVLIDGLASAMETFQ